MAKVIFPIIASLVAILIAVPTSRGGDCRRITYTQPYVQTYHATNYDYYNTVLVPKAFAVQVPLASYTSVGDEFRQLYFARQIAEELAKINASRPSEPIQPAAGPNAPPAAGPPGATNLAPKVYTTIKDVIFNRCASCHDPKKDPARTNWAIDPDKIPGKIAKAGALKCTLGLMPKRGPQLPDSELGIIATWADQKGDD